VWVKIEKRLVNHNYQDTDNNLEDFQITHPTPKTKNE